MVVHQERRALVQRLRKIAKAYDAQRVPDSAGKDAVVAMVGVVLSIPTLSSQDRATTLGIEEASSRHGSQTHRLHKQARMWLWPAATFATRCDQY